MQVDEFIDGVVSFLWIAALGVAILYILGGA